MSKIKDYLIEQEEAQNQQDIEYYDYQLTKEYEKHNR